MTGERYRQEIMETAVVPHFDGHSVATRPVYMDDNAIPRRARQVTAFLQHNAITAIPWPTMRPDLNPLEHTWDIPGCKLQQLDPPVVTLRNYSKLYTENGKT